MLQHRLPYDPSAPPPLPGVAPLEEAGWLRVDEAYAGQMAEKARLLAARAEAVIAQAPAAQEAAEELLEEVLAALGQRADFGFEEAQVICPDGRRVTPDASAPMESLARLVQEDFCILQKRGAEHVLTAAALCFPASWSLEEKFQRPLVAIHAPVESYDAGVAKRVQRLFDGVRAGRPLWRFNALWYADAALHQPRSAHARRDERFAERAAFLRSELQTIRRLPQTGAVVFGIHTYVLTRANAERLIASP